MYEAGMKKLEDDAKGKLMFWCQYYFAMVYWNTKEKESRGRASFKLGLESILLHLTGDGFYLVLCDNATAV
jgi:hypothetical protein